MTFPQPTDSPVSRPWWSALAEGKLTYQHCAACGHDWLPPRDACPACLAPSPEWRVSAGRGRVLSWIVYHTAYDPAFADRVPYDVTLIALDEGPQMLTNIIDSDAGRALRLGAPVQFDIGQEGELAIARFRLVRE